MEEKHVHPCQHCLLSTPHPRHHEHQGLGRLNLHTLRGTPQGDPHVILCPIFSDAIPVDRDFLATEEQLAVSEGLHSSDESKLLVEMHMGILLTCTICAVSRKPLG